MSGSSIRIAAFAAVAILVDAAATADFLRVEDGTFEMGYKEFYREEDPRGR